MNAETPDGRDDIADVVPFDPAAHGPRHRRTKEKDIGAKSGRIADLSRGTVSRRLGQLIGTDDAVPDAVLDAAKGSFRLGFVDDQLAPLIYDSLIDQERLLDVRGGADTSRQLTFACEEVLLEVEVGINGQEQSLTCQLVPPQPASLDVRHREGSISLGEDEYGTFHLRAIPRGPLSLRCALARRPTVAVSTSWITI